MTVRRQGQGGAPDTAAPAGATPFAGISLMPPAAGSGSAAAANPFAGISLLAKPAAAAPAEATPAAAKEEEKAGPGPTAAAADKAAAGGEAASKPVFGSSSMLAKGGFGALASVAATGAFGASAAGDAAAAGAKPADAPAGGFGGFGGFGSSTGTGIGGFKFDTGAAAAPMFAPFTAAAKSAAAPVFFGPGSGDGAGRGPNLVFGAPEASAASDDADAGTAGGTGLGGSRVAAKEQVPRRTGEEDETTLYHTEGGLYEYDGAASRWRERGKGQFHLNVNAAGKARVLMRAAGSGRLLLNANLAPNMTLQRSGAGVIFGVVNAALAGEGAAEGAEGEGAAADAAGAGSAAAAEAAVVASDPHKTRLYTLKVKGKAEQAEELYQFLVNAKPEDNQQPAAAAAGAGGDDAANAV